MIQPSWGTVMPMEETPICASVERDLDLSVDELVTSTASTASTGSTASAPAAPDTGKQAPA
ncbi:hypothetical protein GCM10009606_28580 [Nocardioides aquiterrae]|uniref:Uncharacterized protein n=1 Tax=Nocardioides aquiterrae TaxID=203799 RepID=A0ABN1UEW7_9ACTN